MATARIVPELTGTVSTSVQMMLKSPRLGHSFQLFTPSFNRQLLSNYDMSGTLLGTGNTMVNKTWFLTLMMIHHCSLIVRLYDHIVTDEPKLGKKKEWKECNSDPRLGVLYLKSPLKPWAYAGSCVSWHSGRQMWNQQLSVVIIVNLV